MVPAGTWTQLISTPPGTNDIIGTMLLLSNGSVMAQVGQGYITNSWFNLTPDATGNYVHGSWTQLASMSTPRLYYASNVLPSGKVFVYGGEYTNPTGPATDASSGELYDPVANSWSRIATIPTSLDPSNQFGDDPSEVLPNGKVLAGYISGPQTFLYDPATNTWSAGPTKLRGDQSDEETWVKLPDGSILSYDVFASAGTSNGTGTAQRYVPATNTWVDAGTVPVRLSSSAVGYELGPAFLLSDGRVFYLGGNGTTAYYTPSSNSWSAGPSIPNGDVAADAPGAMLPNGDVLFAASPLGTLNAQGAYSFPSPTRIYEFDPFTGVYTNVTPPNSFFLPSENSFLTRMLVLPSGQVLLADSSGRLDVYTPDATVNSFQFRPASVQPTISNITSSGNGTYTLTGTRLNGISEGAVYGDDAEMAENYPLVQVRDSTGNVLYGRTFNWSSTGVATGSTPETTDFTLPPGAAPGPYTVSVIANGISSARPATQLVVTTQPQANGNLGLGSRFTVSVAAEDPYGNLDTTFNGPVTISLASNPGGATLGGTLTAYAADGVALFDDLTLSATGSGYTLQVQANLPNTTLTSYQAGGNTFLVPTYAPGSNSVSVQSNPFNVIPPQTLVVTTAAEGHTQSPLSLRGALDQANADAAHGLSDVITFAPGLGPIHLTQGYLEFLAGAGEATGVITIDGGGQVTLIDDNSTVNSNSGGIFTIDNGVSANLTGLTIERGTSGWFGGISNQGTLSLSNSTLIGEGLSSTFASEFVSGIDYLFGSATLNNITIRGYSGTGISNHGLMTVSNSTISGNQASGYNTGGGISNTGTMTVSNSTISANSVSTISFGGGGGIYNEGTLTLSGSTVSDNVDYSSSSTLSGVYSGGGGIYNDGNGSLTVSSSTISGNSTNADGGGLYNVAGRVTISGSTISGNSTSGNGSSNNSLLPPPNGAGGGIYSNASLTLSNSTLAGNSAYLGGGLFVDADTSYGGPDVSASTISGNSANEGGGIYSWYYLTPRADAEVALQDSIVAGNTFTRSGSTPDVSGPVASGSAYNLIGDGTGLSGISNGDANHNQVGTGTQPLNPGLAPLGNYGGPTQTFALLGGSPAIAAGGAVTTVSHQVGPSSPTIYLSDGNAIGSSPGQYFILVDGEEMEVTNPVEGRTTFGDMVTVQRGIGGTTPATLNVGDQVYLFADQRGVQRLAGGEDIGAFQTEATRTQVLGLPNPSVYGQGVTFTATVSTTAPWTDTPTGTVQFLIDGSAYGNPVSLSGGSASISVATLGAGPHTVSARYNGAIGFRTSDDTASPWTETVNQDATSTALAGPASPSVTGQVVTFTATVTANAPGAGTPTGKVDFFDTTTNTDLGQVSLSGGSATLATSSLASGSHAVTATYLGDANFLTSGSAAATQTVNLVYDSSQANPSQNLQAVINTQAQSASTTPVSFQASTSTDATNVVNAVNGLTAPGAPVTVNLSLTSGAYTDIQASPPANVTLVITGNGTTTTIVGHSPALTVTSGNVVVTGVTFTTDTDAPTILVTGGNLTLRDDTVQESSGFTDAALSLTGSGTLDLGTATDPGNNQLEVVGKGELVHNTTTSPVSAVGDTFSVNGATQPSALSFTSAATSNATTVYGQAVTLTATVRPNGPGTPTGVVDFFDTTTGTDLGSGTLQVVNGADQASWTTTSLGAGTHTILASYGGDGNFALSLDLVAQTVTQASPTVAVSDAGGTYNGQPFPASATVAGVDGVAASSLEKVSPTLTYYAGTYTLATLPGSGGSGTAPIQAGSYTVVASFPGSTDYTGGAALGTFTIAQATPVVSVSDAGGTYNGQPFPASALVNGGSSLEGVSPTLTYYAGTYTLATLPGSGGSSTAPTQAGSYTVVASFPGSADYTSGATLGTFSIAQATPVVSVSDAGGTYNGQPFPASATVAGVVSSGANADSVPGGSLEGVGLTLTYYQGSYSTLGGLDTAIAGGLAGSGTAPTTGGSYTVVASFAGSADYGSGRALAPFTIAQATPQAAINSVSEVTYDGHSHGTTGSVLGVGGVLLTNSVVYTDSKGNVLSSAPVDAGTYTATVSYAGDRNYHGASASTQIVIDKANASVTIHPYSGTYDGQAHGLTGTAAGVLGEDLSSLLTLGSGYTNPGTYTVAWSFAGNADYNAANSTATVSITRATPTVTVSDTGGTYNGQPFPASASVAGVVSNGANADSTPGSSLEGIGLKLEYFQWNGSAYADIGPSAPIHAGQYQVTASFAGSTDYLPASKTVSFTIAQASPTVPTPTVPGGAVYDGQPHGATDGDVTGVNSVDLGAPTLTYYAGTYTLATLPGSGGSSTAPTQAGSYTVVASFPGSADYTSGSALATFTIAQATPTFSVTATTVLTDGTPSVTLSGNLSDGSLIPPGNVTVTLDGQSQTVAIGPGGSFSANFATASLNVGAHSLGFSYGGDRNFTAASATGTLDDTYAVLALFNQTQAKHPGSTLPIKIELATAAGQDVSSGGVNVTALGIAATTDTTDLVGATSTSGPLMPVQSAGGSNPGNVFRYQGGPYPFYLYNLQIPTGLTAGTYRLYLSVQNDPLLHWVLFTVS